MCVCADIEPHIRMLVPHKSAKTKIKALTSEVRPSKQKFFGIKPFQQLQQKTLMKRLPAVLCNK